MTVHAMPLAVAGQVNCNDGWISRRLR